MPSPISRRKPRFRLWIWLSLAGLLGLLVFGTRHSGQPLQSRQLPDGSTVSVAAMTFGPEHRFAPGRPERQLISFLIPEKLLFVPAFRTFARTEPDPKTPVVWITYLGKRPSAPNSFFSDGDWTVLDSHGGERPMVEQQMSYAPNNHYNVQALSLRHYPRRARWIHLRRYTSGRHPEKPPVVEFSIPNPYPGPYPQWTAPKPPVRINEPGLDCTLRTFRNGVDAQDPTKPPR